MLPKSYMYKLAFNAYRMGASSYLINSIYDLAHGGEMKVVGGEMCYCKTFPGIRLTLASGVGWLGLGMLQCKTCPRSFTQQDFAAQ